MKSRNHIFARARFAKITIKPKTPGARSSSRRPRAQFANGDWKQIATFVESTQILSQINCIILLYMNKWYEVIMVASEDVILKMALSVYGYVGLWIFLSGAVITFNKFLLAVAGFPYPITLTMWYAKKVSFSDCFAVQLFTWQCVAWLPSGTCSSVRQ